MLDNQRPAPGETAGPLRLRPAHPGDAAAIAGMLAGLSGRSALVEALGARGIATLQAVTLLENAGIRRLFARSPQPYTARFDGGMLVYRMGLGASMR
jgi:hypothetical protein